MKLAIIGSGNVASATALELARGNVFQRILWTARDLGKVEASLRDVVSVFPKFATLGHATRSDAKRINADILRSYVPGNVKDTSIVVIVASPVDDLTAIGAKLFQLPTRQIIGFGGDLDVHRLDYVLARRALPTRSIAVIGEHGARAIPVYRGEVEYGSVASELREFLAHIWRVAGKPRNLATGVLLCRLLNSLGAQRLSRHHVTTYCPEYEQHLTWPSVVSAEGVVDRLPLQLGPAAQRQLGDLLALKRAEDGSSLPIDSEPAAEYSQ